MVLKMRKMKDSGIEWIGEIPEGWRTINPKALFTQRKDKAQKGERQLTSSQQYGILYQDDYMELTGSKVVTVEKDFDILKHVEAGDFVISMRSFQGGLEYSTKSGAISSAYVMLVPNLELVYPRFYRWLLKSSVYIDALQRTTNMVRDDQAMRYSNFAQVRLFTLPLDEQKSRADFLDLECSSIDKILFKTRSSIEEYKKLKQAVITQAVTKGVRGEREIKESKLPWASKIPKAWNICAIRHIMFECKERTKDGHEEQLSVTQQFGIIKSSDASIANPSLSLDDWRIVAIGDIVFNKYKAHSGVFFVSPFSGIVTFNYSVYRCFPNCYAKYFEYQYKTHGCISEFRTRMHGVGNSISPLYTKDLMKIKVVCPPLDEQKEIANYLDAKCAEIDRLIAKKEQLVKELESYKKSLIYEVVTGKREV